MERIHRTIELTHSTSPTSLAFFRVLLASYALLFVLPIGTSLPELSAALFHPPPGLPRLFGGFPSSAAVIVGNVIAASFAFMLLIGYRARATAVGLTLSLLTLNAWQFSAGKIDHGILFVMAPMMFAWSGWHRTWSVGKPATPADASQPTLLDGHAGNRCAFLFAMMIGLSMGTAAIAKIYGGWFDVGTSSTLGYAILVNWYDQRPGLLFETARQTMAPWMWEAMDWTAVAFELAAMVAFLRRSWWRWWLVVAVLFHTGVWVKFSIVFAANLLAYAAFVRWDSFWPLASRDDAGDDASRTPAWVWAWAIAIAVVATTHALVAQTSLMRSLPQEARGLIFCVPALAIAAGWALRQLLGLFPRRHTPATTTSAG